MSGRSRRPPTTKNYPGLRPENLRIGDYPILTLGNVLETGFIPFTNEAELHWRGLGASVERALKGKHRGGTAEVKESSLRKGNLKIGRTMLKRLSNRFVTEKN